MQRRILAITVDHDEAPFRLRIEILRNLLRDDGFEFDFVPRPASFLGRLKLVSTAGRYHAVIVQRKLLDPTQAWLLRKKARRIFYDIDDAVMTQRRKIGKISRWLKGRRFRATTAIMDRIVVGNDNLGRTFTEMGKPVTLLPTVVDPDHYHSKIHAPTSQPTLVWIGSKSTLPYLQQWLPVLESASKMVPGLRLLVIANAAIHSEVIPVEFVPWSLETEAAALARGDIGIAPTPLDPWTLGKCGFKIIQYMASGLPTIASPVGMNRLLVNAEVGLLADTVADWTTAIATLSSDVSLRKQMGASARLQATENYSLNRARQVWRDLLNS